MLKLTIHEPAPDGHASTWATGPGAYVWRDVAGNPCAYGHTVDGRHWMHWPGLASYSFDGTGPEIVAIPFAAGREESIVDTFERMVLPLALQIRGREALHASAVVVGGGVVGFCASSGTGKSTLAYALHRFAGCAQWSDDVLVVDVAGDGIEAVPLPFSSRLWPETAAALTRLPSASRSPVSANGAPSVRKLRALCVLTRAPSAADPVSISPIPPTRAFRHLLEHAHCFDLLDAARKRRMLDHYLDLVERVGVFEVTFPQGFNQLPSVARSIADAFAQDTL